MTLPTLSLLYYRGQEGLRGLRLCKTQRLLRPNTPNLTRDLTAHLSLCFYWLFPARGVNLLKLLDFFENEARGAKSLFLLDKFSLCFQCVSEEEAKKNANRKNPIKSGG